MKKYTNAKAEIYKLDAGDIMLTSINSMSFEDLDKNESQAYSTWTKWN